VTKTGNEHPTGGCNVTVILTVHGVPASGLSLDGVIVYTTAAAGEMGFPPITPVLVSKVIPLVGAGDIAKLVGKSVQPVGVNTVASTVTFTPAPYETPVGYEQLETRALVTFIVTTYVFPGTPKQL
jgi:hypothetical protein